MERPQGYLELMLLALNGTHILGFVALAAFTNLKFDRLAFLQRAVSRPFDV
jgi:hypothetical protein